ncbi:MAG: DUF4189 domain-containing protein [Sphingopyxis sp.]|nr:DUF4189 domain-containing protein [Sphingopyxis sp.]
MAIAYLAVRCISNFNGQAMQTFPKFLLFIAAFIGVAAATSGQAKAQSCPAGIPGGGNPGCIPPDVYHGNQGNGQAGSSASAEPLYLKWQSGNSALVVHPDVTDVWAVWNTDSVEGAKEIALEGCTKVMGKGCFTAITSTGGTIAFGRGPNGFIRANWGKKKADAVKKFHQECAADGIVCQLQETFTSTHIKRPASVPIQRAMAHLPETRAVAAFGAVATPKVDAVGTKWQGHAWLITGRTTYTAAADQAMSRCQADTGMVCGVDTHGVNSNIYLYTTQDDYFFWSVALSRDDATTNLAKTCKQRHKGKKCVITSFYDMQTSRNEVVRMQWNR